MEQIDQKTDSIYPGQLRQWKTSSELILVLRKKRQITVYDDEWVFQIIDTGIDTTIFGDNLKLHSNPVEVEDETIWPSNRSTLASS